MSSKYVFLDIDGTLVNFKGEAPSSAIKALKAARKNGHKLFVCTGRQLSQVYPWLLEQVEFDGIISSSGANIRAGKVQICRHCLPIEKLLFLADYFFKNNIPYCIQSQDTLVMESWCLDMIMQYYAAQGIDNEKVKSLFGGIEIVDDIKTLDIAEKIVYYNAPKETEGVSEDIGDFFQVVRYSFGNASKTSGEITCRRYNKATGIQEVLDFFGADRADTVAVGDGDNDLEMMEYAAFGVAMGNATSKLKAAADFITEDIDKDGIYKAFLELNLI